MSEHSMEKKIDKIAQSESFWHKYVLQIVLIVFVAGGGWVTLSNVQALAEENKADIKEEVERAQEVAKKLVRIETKQEQLAEDVDEVQKKLDLILAEVRKQGN